MTPGGREFLILGLEGGREEGNFYFRVRGRKGGREEENAKMVSSRRFLRW